MDVVHEIVCLKPIYSIKNNVQVIYNAKMTYKHLKYVHDLAFGRQSCLQRVSGLTSAGGSTKAVAISTVTHKLLSGYILSLPRFDEGSGILI